MLLDYRNCCVVYATTGACLRRAMIIAFAARAIYDFPTNQAANFLGFADENLSDAGSKFDGFDANVLSEFEYSAFDFQLAGGSLTNQLGQTLAISELGPPSAGTYSLVATVVPEPRSMAVMFALLPACALYRLRFSRSCNEHVPGGG